jgi:hypothetical protein
VRINAHHPHFLSSKKQTTGQTVPQKNKANTHAAAGRTRNDYVQNVQTVAHPKSNKRE